MTGDIVRVGEVSEQVRGVTYGKGDASATPQHGYLPILRAGNISDAGVVFDDLVYVPAAKVSQKQLLRAGDVLIAASSGSLDVVGKAAPVLSNYEGAFGAFCKVLRPNAKRVDPRYFSHFFRTAGYRRIVSSLAAGANINNLRNEHLDDLVLPLPPVAAQRRIAAILDNADALRTKRREALAQLDRLAQSMFVEMFGDPTTNPKKLEKVSLGDLIRVKSGNFLPASGMVTDGPYAVFGGNGVNGYHNEYMFDDRQIVIGRVGVYCGCVHTTPSRSWVTDNALYVSEHDSRVDFDFLAYSLKLANLNQYASQSAQPLISGSRIYPVEILVPPTEQQAEFIARVSATKKVGERFADSSNELDALFASLQLRAFGGEL